MTYLNMTYQSISVQYYCVTHSYINVLACICMYVSVKVYACTGVSLCIMCMYLLEYMYQCIRINPTVNGKECKN
jgi:hypothetical protein